MRKLLLLIALGCLISLSLNGQEISTSNLIAEGKTQIISVQSSNPTISLRVRQNDFSRIAVSASSPVPETVYVYVVVWHAPPGIWSEEYGADVATMTLVLSPGEMNASEVLYLGGEPAYIIGGVYSASAYPKSSPSKANYSVTYY